MYVCRRNGTRVVNLLYQNHPDSLEAIFIPDKPIQFGSPTLTATKNGEIFILAQVVNREDEIMMIDFR